MSDKHASFPAKISLAEKLRDMAIFACFFTGVLSVFHFAVARLSDSKVEKVMDPALKSRTVDGQTFRINPALKTSAQIDVSGRIVNYWSFSGVQYEFCTAARRPPGTGLLEQAFKGRYSHSCPDLRFFPVDDPARRFQAHAYAALKNLPVEEARKQLAKPVGKPAPAAVK